MLITIGLIILAMPIIAMAYGFLHSSPQKLAKSGGGLGEPHALIIELRKRAKGKTAGEVIEQLPKAA